MPDEEKSRARYRKPEHPALYIRKRVLDDIARDSSKYPDLETGEALVGVVGNAKDMDIPKNRQAVRFRRRLPLFSETERIVFAGKTIVNTTWRVYLRRFAHIPDDALPGRESRSEDVEFKPERQKIYILGTIPPDESATRRWGTVQMGDEQQYDHFLWLTENWYEDAQQEEQWKNLPLKHLGDWHKQPSGMIQPSSGDLASARAILDQPHWRLPFILQPIVTRVAHPNLQVDAAQSNSLQIMGENGEAIRIDFWYLREQDRRYWPLIPQIMEEKENSAPLLAEPPWNLKDVPLLTRELNELDDTGHRVSSPFYFNTDGEHPLEFCLISLLREEQAIVLVATNHDYPRSAPRAWQLQLRQQHSESAEFDWLDMVQEAWPSRKDISLPPNWQWSENSSLAAYLSVIEGQLNQGSTARITTDAPPISSDDD